MKGVSGVFYDAHTSQGLACRSWCTAFGIRCGSSFISDLPPSSQNGPASRLRDEFPRHPYLSLPHVHHLLHPAPSPPFSPPGLRPSRRGTTCMISYFVQLIKTSGEIGGRVSRSERGWSAAPLRVLRSLILSSAPSSPLNVLSHQIDSWRLRGEGTEMKERAKGGSDKCVVEPSALVPGGIFLAFCRKKRTDFSFSQGPHRFV